jgi:hypothetical protein
MHRSEAVKQFAESTGGRLRLFFLPGYAPELNLTSGCGSTSSRTGSAGPESAAPKTSSQALAALHRLQKLPHLIQSFFRDPNLRYITA